jgi:hypothetical protein
MTYRQGLRGAATGVALALLHYLWEGFPSRAQSVLLSLLVAAAAGAYWWIQVSIGWRNGYGRPIRWGGAVLGLFLLALCAGHEQREMTPFLALIAGIAVGSLGGATLPLALFRLKARLEPKCKLRRFALLLAAPSLRYHDDNAQCLVSDSDPLETRLLLQQYWGVWDRDDLQAVLESLQSQDRLGQTVEVVRWGVSNQMLSRAEGWTILERVGRRALELYSSWEELAANDPLAEHLQASLRQTLEGHLWRRTPWPKA